jgi:hypothetical protein
MTSAEGTLDGGVELDGTGEGDLETFFGDAF